MYSHLIEDISWGQPNLILIYFPISAGFLNRINPSSLCPTTDNREPLSRSSREPSRQSPTLLRRSYSRSMEYQGNSLCESLIKKETHFSYLKIRTNLKYPLPRWLPDSFLWLLMPKEQGFLCPSTVQASQAQSTKVSPNRLVFLLISLISWLCRYTRSFFRGKPISSRFGSKFRVLLNPSS